MDYGLLEINGRGINLQKGIPTKRRFIGVICRSAPAMTRCIRRPVMSASLDLKVGQPKDFTSISVEDVYVLAEKERARSAYKNRRRVMEQAQKQVRHDEVASRPHSSTSRFLRRCQSLSSSQPQCSRLSSAHSGFKPNTPDSEDPDLSATIHCCEVMGPSVCQECRKVSTRASSVERAEGWFPSLRVTQQNITTSALVKRFYPNLSEYEIHNKIARGEINCSHLPRALQSSSGSDTDDSPQFEDAQKERLKQNERTFYAIARMKQRLRKGEPTTPLYFHSIRDLNYKIQSGSVSRELGFTKNNSKKKVARRESGSGLDLKVFVSPRKVTMFKEPSYKSYFEPPLLPRASQKPEPAFFAGSDFPYKLPDRVPEKLGRLFRLNSSMSIAPAGND